MPPAPIADAEETRVSGTQMEAHLLDLDTARQRIDRAYNQKLAALETVRARLGSTDVIDARRRKGDPRLGRDIAEFKHAAREFNQQAQAMLAILRSIHTLRMALAARDLAAMTSDAIEIQRQAMASMPATEEIETQLASLRDMGDELADTLDHLNARLEQDDGLTSGAVLSVEAAPVFSPYEASLLLPSAAAAPAPGSPRPRPRPRPGPPSRTAPSLAPPSASQ